MKGIKDKENLFVSGLLKWNKAENFRQMPWKGEKDPYKIWVSEIILQQTRVDQGGKYYENFISAFPNIHFLANAPEERVFKLWEGLGYYSRCRNLIFTAKTISKEYNGVFPGDFISLLKLKGIGPYTAAAVSSFAYNLPHAVVDGNVFRVLSRIFGIHTPVDSAEGKKIFASLAQKLLPQNKAAEYNQAIMDFGAVICKPSPVCDSCFFNAACTAFLTSTQHLLPVKKNKIKTSERWLNYFILRHENDILIHQRTGNDIWQQLYEFFLIETMGPVPAKKNLNELVQQLGIKYNKADKPIKISQRLSHQLVNFSFTVLYLHEKQNIAGFSWVKINDIDRYAFPKTLQQLIVRHLLKEEVK